MTVSLTSREAKTSYALGLDVAASLSRLPFALDLAAFHQGMSDLLADAKPRLAPDECRRLLSALQQAARQQTGGASSEHGARNLQEGQAFLDANRAKAGVSTTPSGLQYQVLSAGTGASPTASDRVTVHYIGKLLDGTEFDSSVRRGEPATFPLNGVIPGWTEGVQLMKVGGKTRFFIRPELAYGERGAGEVIGPHSTLIFEVELLSIG
jgi:FKBP-type peptidyl-prolyl cis-trans isomerase